jgi:hypothetical protein
VDRPDFVGISRNLKLASYSFSIYPVGIEIVGSLDWIGLLGTIAACEDGPLLRR